MTFAELTRVMLSSMDFFELRRTAGRYGVSYQGVRRTKLLRDLERKITQKNNTGAMMEDNAMDAPAVGETVSASKPTGRRGGKENANSNFARMKINTYSSGNAVTRVYGNK